jgi:hypothetical protein
MGKRHARFGLAAAAAALTVATGATAALAATTWTVSPGGKIAAKTDKVTFTDLTTGTALTCVNDSANGTLKSGSGLPGAGIGSVTAVSIQNCTGPLALVFLVKAADLPWHLSFASYDAKTGLATGTISGVKVTWAGPACTAVIDGAGGSTGVVKVNYTNRTGRLKLLTADGNLHFGKVTGCAGLINTGDPVTISAAYPLTPTQRITSP